MTVHSNSIRLMLTEEEAELLTALSRFGTTIVELDKDPKALAAAALAFSAVGFAAYSSADDFAIKSKEYYWAIKSSLCELPDDDIFH